MKFSCSPEHRNEGGQEAFPTQDLLIPPEASGAFTPLSAAVSRQERGSTFLPQLLPAILRFPSSRAKKK